MKFFKDQADIEKFLSDDNVINIIWTKWSGKTTRTLKYINSNKYIVINCDRLLEMPSDEKEDEELWKIRTHLRKKYGTIPTWNKFAKCYEDIIKYITEKNKIAVIEWNIIQEIDPKLLKGKIIIKRTSIFKSYIRAVKRDFKNEYFMKQEKERHKYFYKVIRLYKIMKRRKNILKQAKGIDLIIEKLDRTCKK